MLMLSFSNSIFLVGIRTRYVMRDPHDAEERVKSLILTSPFRLNSFNFPYKHSFNEALKLFKELKHLGFLTKKINPSKFTEIIYETNTKFLVTE
jgi:hypothetical protein